MTAWTPKSRRRPGDDAARPNRVGIVLDAKEEFRVDQQPLDRGLDAAFEASDRALLLR